MELKPIRTKTEYKAALREIEGLMDAAPGSPKADKLDVLAMLVGQYKAKHYPIPAPDPIDFLQPA
jgi:HTH-type transcriptional regulator / antitoxin HigA